MCLGGCVFVYVQVFGEMDAGKIKFGDVGADYVVESTGIHTSKEGAGIHLKGGAKKVLFLFSYFPTPTLF